MYPRVDVRTVRARDRCRATRQIRRMPSVKRIDDMDDRRSIALRGLQCLIDARNDRTDLLVRNREPSP